MCILVAFRELICEGDNGIYAGDYLWIIEVLGLHATDVELLDDVLLGQFGAVHQGPETDETLGIVHKMLVVYDLVNEGVEHSSRTCLDRWQQ